MDNTNNMNSQPNNGPHKGKDLFDAITRNSPHANLFWEVGGECIFPDDERLRPLVSAEQMRSTVESREEVMNLTNPLKGERGPVTCFWAASTFVQWCYDIAPQPRVAEIIPLLKPLNEALVKNQVNLARILEKDLLFQLKGWGSIGAAAGTIGVRVGDPAAYTVICCFGLMTPPVHWQEQVRGLATEGRELVPPFKQMQRSFEDARKCTILKEQRLLEQGEVLAAWQLRQLFMLFLDGLRDRQEEDKKRAKNPFI